MLVGLVQMEFISVYCEYTVNTNHSADFTCVDNPLTCIASFTQYGTVNSYRPTIMYNNVIYTNIVT